MNLVRRLRIRFNIITYLEKGIRPVLSSYTQFLDDHYMAQVWFLMQRWLDSGCCLLPRMCYCFQVKSAIIRKNKIKVYIHIHSTSYLNVSPINHLNRCAGTIYKQNVKPFYCKKKKNYLTTRGHWLIMMLLIFNTTMHKWNYLNKQQHVKNISSNKRGNHASLCLHYIAFTSFIKWAINQ